MTNVDRFAVGDFVVFVADSATIEGHIRLRCGQHITIETASREVFTVDVSAISGLVGDQAIEPSSMHLAYLSGIYEII